MSNDCERVADWWASLDKTQRGKAATVKDALPKWMAISLANFGVEVVSEPHVAGVSRGPLYRAPQALLRFIAHVDVQSQPSGQRRD